MTYAVSTARSAEILSKIPGSASIAVTDGGMRVRIALADRDTVERYERGDLPEVEKMLIWYGIRPSSRQVTGTQIVIHAVADADVADDLMSFTGRVARISPYERSDVPGHVLLLDDTIVPMPWTNPELALTRDGDRVKVEYRRFGPGDLRVVGFDNLTLPQR